MTHETESSNDNSGLTDEQIIEALATKVMGWRIEDLKFACSKDGGGRIFSKTYYWNPLTNWNHWRQVEEKVMEDEQLWRRFVSSFCYEQAEPSVEEYMVTDRPTRCRALLAALSSTKP